MTHYTRNDEAVTRAAARKERCVEGKVISVVSTASAVSCGHVAQPGP